MASDQAEIIARQSPPSSHRGVWLVVIAGAYLTLRGYHSFDGDQAYRLPLLLHRQNPALYAADPFVRAFDAFNPHRGYLALLDWASRPLGLAPALAGLFALTLAGTMLGVDRLARTVWPDRRAVVGLVAVALILLAKGGNIGTNHLFEGTLLDRLVAFALGWQAIAALVADPRRGAGGAALALGLATLVHPSVGLQLSLTLGAALGVWALAGRTGTAVRPAWALVGLGGLGLALVPGLSLVAGQGGQLLAGMPPDEFRHWAVAVQGPQHMLPSTWRLPQWLAFGCYPVLALLAWVDHDRAAARPAAQIRFGWLLLVNLASLVLAYGAVAGVEDLRITVFQPFRMATLARGLCLVALAGRMVRLWERGGAVDRARGIMLGSGLVGDWSLVVVTAAEVVAALVARRADRHWASGAWAVTFGGGLVFLGRHDLEGGGRVLGLTGFAWLVLEVVVWPRSLGWNRRRRGIVLGLAWVVPVGALGAGLAGSRFVADHPLAEALVRRCRWVEVPTDDAERLAVWCRSHTPADARFIGPPGEKDFRLWSRRALAFNRAGSPYHAAGLRDWSARFRDHVGFSGPPADFARAYLAGRHDLEARYGRMTAAAKLALAQRQGATFVLERGESATTPEPRPGLTLVYRQGDFAVFRVDPPAPTAPPGLPPGPPRTEPR